MNTKLVVWNKEKIRLLTITGADEPNPKRPNYDVRQQVQELAYFLIGHITGDTFDYFINAMAETSLNYDKITNENIERVANKMRQAIDHLAELRER